MSDIIPLRTIGLLGGMSWESSALYYRDINQHVRNTLGGLYSAPIVLDSVNFAQMDAWLRMGAWEHIAHHLSQRAQALEGAGAHCIAIATNTMHKVYAHIAAAVNVPVLHIATPTIAQLRNAGITRIAFLGTRYSMEQDFLTQVYRTAGVDVLVPNASERDVVHHVIFNELCQGVVNDTSRKQYQTIIASLAAQGAQAVVLGCTEITLLLSAEDVSLPMFDTAALHARALADVALMLNTPEVI
ncbi:Aspartate racemase [Ephemeroptericola cinctiostellae]|uniref:Aspartate racemase n=1 Tax=Ephemeroptericola cinctiostellae TaxID=2268024 RepID=A0A345DDU1_9BURK|nr:aspartate/glutamate racemase family protein [Ephemeroptericola cinctiostellae]AXF86529.1 Aspartate racemase [Ephemeroptericola cinctiostellae]